LSDTTETIAFRMVLRKGAKREYRERHDKIWPELVEALRGSGVVDYRIFLDNETGHLFAVLTRKSVHSMAPLRENPIMLRWWKMMADIMETNADSSPEEVPLSEMFHLRVN